MKFTLMVRRSTDKVAHTEECTRTLAVTGQEKIKVPAGEFEAYKIERVTDFTGVRTNRTGRWYGHNTVLGWHVTALRKFVALARERRLGNSAPPRVNEMCSPAFQGAAQKPWHSVRQPLLDAIPPVIKRTRVACGITCAPIGATGCSEYWHARQTLSN